MLFRYLVVAGHQLPRPEEPTQIFKNLSKSSLMQMQVED